MQEIPSSLASVTSREARLHVVMQLRLQVEAGRVGAGGGWRGLWWWE